MGTTGIKINNPTPDILDYFGAEQSLSLYEDTLVIGAYGHDYDANGEGALYVYTRTTGVWSLQQTILNPTPIENDYFGAKVSLYQDTIIVMH